MKLMFVIALSSVFVFHQSCARGNICQSACKTIIPHPTKCAQYYDCADNTKMERWPQYLKECPYEQLFDVDTKTCKHYWLVKCGEREEPISYCDYEKNRCRYAHCIPCYAYHPSCKNLPDGLNRWEGRERSPYFVVCKNNRTVYQGSCVHYKATYLFDAERRGCLKQE